MPGFSYIRPKTIEETLTHISDPKFNNRILAGGTDLMIELRNASPVVPNLRLVDISRLPDFHQITPQNNALLIGSAVTYHELITNPVVRSNIPILAEACSTIGSPQVRNIATIGGNIANAAACADTLPVLACLQASVAVISTAGNRLVPVEQFVLRKNCTCLDPGECITHFVIPLPTPGAKGAFIKLGRRNAATTSRITVAVIGRTDSNGNIAQVKIVPGSVSDTIQLFPEAEKALLGHPPSEQNFHRCSSHILNTIVEQNSQRWSSSYKVPVLGKLIERALVRVFC